MSPFSEPVWQVWIDTGGTFTDCIARAPSGELLRVKVLSSSALRGSILEQTEPARFRIAEKWGAPGGFVNGFEFKILNTPHPEVKVQSYEPESQRLVLDRSLDLNGLENTAFEVQSPYEAPILAARLVTQTKPDQSLPTMAIRLATTRGTNALLERKGSAVALFITKGFRDLLQIGNQQRPDIFALEIRKPKPLYKRVVEIDERLAADGTILRPLDLSQLENEVERLLEEGTRVAAVALMHSYLNPAHEEKVTEWLAECGFEHVSRSSELAPFIKIVPRAETTVVDAYLAPVINDYLGRVRAELAASEMHVMTSAGGLIGGHEFRAKDCLLSGPAGGVVGAASAGRLSGFEKVIAFDMGGTSTDVARVDGDYEYVFEHEVGDAHLVATALAIESVAAGGGSICTYDGYRLKVGPESASAQPGPACYGAGGPLTLTDVNLLLGRLDPDGFDIPISMGHAKSKIEELLTLIEEKTGEPETREILLQGFLDIANERMADAIRRVSVRKGYDPREYALVAFGGAGGQHACAIAERLGIRTVVVPEDASLLSAHGLGHAVVERFTERQILQPFDEVEGQINMWFDELTAQAKQAVASEGIPSDEIEVRRRMVNMRFVGQDSSLSIEQHGKQGLQEGFREKYGEIFGHLPEGRRMEIESIRVVCSSKPSVDSPSNKSLQSRRADREGFTRACFDGKWQDVPFFLRSKLSGGHRISGPALIFERHSAIALEREWNGVMDAAGALILSG